MHKPISTKRSDKGAQEIATLLMMLSVIFSLAQPRRVVGTERELYMEGVQLVLGCRAQCESDSQGTNQFCRNNPVIRLTL